MLRVQTVSVTNCPIRLKVCHYTCYWHKKNKCVFPAEGYNARGQVNRRKN